MGDKHISWTTRLLWLTGTLLIISSLVSIFILAIHDIDGCTYLMSSQICTIIGSFIFICFILYIHRTGDLESANILIILIISCTLIVAAVSLIPAAFVMQNCIFDTYGKYVIISTVFAIFFMCMMAVLSYKIF